MKTIRKQLTWLLPALAVFMIGALVLSRVIKPETDQQPQRTISAEQAADYIGKYVEVCDDVIQATHATGIDGSPVFLNFGDAHPNQIFTVVIWERFHSLWPQTPHRMFDQQYVCAEGEIELHQGTPQIEVRSPDRIRIEQK